MTESDSHDRQRDRDNLAAHAQAHSEATWGGKSSDSTDDKSVRVPGFLSGEVGPKGEISSELRGVSRTERQLRGNVPTGATAPGSNWYLLAGMFAIAFGIFAIVGFIFWVIS